MISKSNLQVAFQAQDITSAAMKNAIDDWFQLYYLKEATKDEDPCEQVAHTIVKKLTKAVFSEYTATSKNAFASRILRALKHVYGEVAQQTFIGGMSLLKPIPENGGFSFAVVRRDNLLIFGRNAKGELTDIGTWERTIQGKHYYTLLERRTVDGNGYLTIKNALYRSYTENDLGSLVSLDTMPRYAQLQETYTFTEPIYTVGLVPVCVPIENCVDGSADSVSIFAAAAGKIHNLNRNEAQLNGEFDRGKSKIIASADMFRRGKDGKRAITDDVFVGLDDDSDAVGITIFSPPLREASFLARKQDYLRSIENIIGLKRGLLSEVEAVERTAKEITSSEGDYNLTVIALQKMWETAVKDTLQLCSVLGRLYQIPDAQEVAEEDIEIDFGNGVLYDEEKIRGEMLSQVQAGLLQPERYIGHCYNLPCDTPAQREKIRKNYMPGMESMLDEIDLAGENLPTSDDNSAGNVKMLNGAQTQSLLAVITQYQAGQLTIGQAVNVLSVAIGVDKIKAKAIIEGAID